MGCDREKLTSLRTNRALTQEALAGKAKMDVRTIQRAEAGKPIGLQTIQEIASALGVAPSEIMVEERTPVEDTYDGETVAVVLKPQPSARWLLGTLSDCHDCKLSCSADLIVDMVEPAKEFCNVIRPMLPELWPTSTDDWFSSRVRDEASRLADRIDLQAKLNDVMFALRNVGLEVFAGTYVDYKQIPSWDAEEGCFSVRTTQKPEPVKIALVQIAEVQERSIQMRVKCDLLPF
jgi:transcriptional regulator with XRE-family HTH domain